MGTREVKIENAQGVCAKEKFQKLIKAGQLVAEKVDEHLNEKLVLVGICKVTIKTDDKEFSVYNYVTNTGLVISSGSEFLYKSTENIEMNEESVIKKVKTKKGHTYVFNPIFSLENIMKDDTGSEDDLPF